MFMSVVPAFLNSWKWARSRQTYPLELIFPSGRKNPSLLTFQDYLEAYEYTQNFWWLKNIGFCLLASLGICEFWILCALFYKMFTDLHI